MKKISLDAEFYCLSGNIWLLSTLLHVWPGTASLTQTPQTCKLIGVFL